MPLILAKKRGRCTACGGAVAKGEEALYTAATGLRHPERACSQAAPAQRPNQRAGPCAGCGRWVEKGEGRLLHLGEEQLPSGAWRQRWEIRCVRCGNS